MEDQSEEAKKIDDWWRVRDFVHGFYQRRVDMLNLSLCFVLDESMSPMMPRYVRIFIAYVDSNLKMHTSLLTYLTLF